MKRNQSLTELINWCDQQEDSTRNTINMLLDTKKHKTAVGKKALTIASEILKTSLVMREALNQELVS
jgi:hypothetical protein